MAWKSWTHLCFLNEQGRMGFRDLRAFNLALLAKQACKLITEPNSFLSRVLKAKYFPHMNPMETASRVGISYIWQSLLHDMRLVKQGIRGGVGDGLSINAWLDP